MPDFSFASVPGLDGNFSIANNASGVPVQIGLKDAVLFLPGQQRLPLAASHRQGPGGLHLLTLTGSFAPPKLLLAGQLILEDITLTLRFLTDSAGALVLDTASPGAVVATGHVKWVGAQVLGIQNGLPLTLSYVFRQGGAGGFALSIANPPLPVPGGFVEIQSGEIQAELPADRPVLAITLRGQAGLTQTGMAQISGLLAQAFPSAPQLQPLGFVVHQEFALQNGSIPTSPQPAGTPFFRFDFDWPQGGAPALPNLPQPLQLDMGKPSFSFPLDGSAPSGWSFRLPQTGIRFPDLAGLAPFQLLGTLQLDTGPVNRFLFQPAGEGGFDLPDPLKFLFSRLGWAGSGTPLDQLEPEAQRSISEFEWQDLFTGLIPIPLPSAGLDLVALGAQLEQALLNSMQTSGLELPRIFITAMQGLQAGGRGAYGVLWQKWFSPAFNGPNPLAQLPDLLLAMTSMTAGAFEDAVNALFDALPDIGDFASQLLRSWAAGIGTRFEVFLDAFTRTLQVALSSQPPAKLNALGDGLLDAALRLPELQTLVTLPRLGGMQLPELPLGDGLLAVTFATLSAPQPGGQVKLAGLFDGLFSRAKASQPGESQRAKDAVINAASPESAHRDFLLKNILESAVSHAMPWWDLVDRPVNPEARPARNLLNLPAGKYLIVSDVHRDRKSDIGQAFRFNSISHFQANRELFKKVIDWADQNVYCLIEGGDCEELWFLRKKSENDRNQILSEIIADNQDVYQKLRGLHDQGRYYRIFGNHDSQLREIAACGQTLASEMDQSSSPVSITSSNAGSPALINCASAHGLRSGDYVLIAGHSGSTPSLNDRQFQITVKSTTTFTIPDAVTSGGSGGTVKRAFHIYDFIILDGVKSMVEHAPLNKGYQLAKDIIDGKSAGQIAAGLADGVVGMDAEDYKKTNRMLITHGHQWDFYNCDSNNLIGQFIAQEVAVRVDKAMDPLLTIRGLALGGNPWIDFGEILASKPITNCWPSEQDAVRLAHQIQHMANKDRKLVDSPLYKESLTAITGTFGIALNAPAAPGQAEITPDQSRQNVDLTRPSTILDYLDKHHNHHICIGHTHNPHSQPFFALKSVLTGLPYLGNIFQFLPSVLPGNPNLFKSKYLNSGTGGWWNGVIWAIQVDETGQARLVYWTNNTSEPQQMDWELTKWEERSAFPKTKDEILRMLEDFFANVINLDINDMQALLESVAGTPMELFQAALARGQSVAAAVQSTLEEVAAGAETALREFQEWTAEIQAGLVELLLTLRARASGFRNSSQDTFTLSVPVSDAVRRQLKEDIERIKGTGQDAEAQALHAACIAFPLLEHEPRTLILPSMANLSLFPALSILDFSSPVFALFSSVVSFFPPAGRLARVGDQTITSRITFTNNETRLSLTVTMEPANGATGVVNIV